MQSGETLRHVPDLENNQEFFHELVISGQDESTVERAQRLLKTHPEIKLIDVFNPTNGKGHHPGTLTQPQSVFTHSSEVKR